MRVLEIQEKYLSQYLECVGDLNSKGVSKADLNQAKDILYNRPENIVTLIGIVDERLVATCTLLLEDKLRYNQKSCHIEDVAVVRDSRGKGYGKEILKYAIEYAKKSEKCYKIMLTCKNHLVQYYSDSGFKTTDNNMVIYVKDNDDNVDNDLGN